MFTGLIQTIGSLYHLSESQLRIGCGAFDQSVILEDSALGDSIAVDGVCLTVEQILANAFVASISPETLARTTLGTIPDGAPVNLESSLRVGSKIGGHFVTGHIDGQGIFDHIVTSATAWELYFSVPSDRVARYIVPKGSIAVNGVSLTVADCSATGDWFTVAVIPVTYRETNLSLLKPGQKVNLEGDILGKYVEKFAFSSARQGNPASTSLGASASISSSISLDFLNEHGYS